MTVPYKEWQLCNVGLMEAHYPSPPGTKSDVSNWTSRHLASCMLGEWNTGNLYDWHWRGAVRPLPNQGFESMSGMDEIIDIETKYILSPFVDSDGKTSFQVVAGILDNTNAWINEKITGKHYDGINQWDHYPPLIRHTESPVTVTVADLPKLYAHYNHSYENYAGNAVSNIYQADFFRNGIGLYLSTYVPGMGAGDKFEVYCWVQAMKVRFLNAVVNNISRIWAPTAGGVEVVLTGLGFKNDDDELDGGGDSNPGDNELGWEDKLEYIDFIRLQREFFEFYDKFNDDTRDQAWDDQPNNGTIVESGGVLTLAIANGVDGNWGTGIKNTPFSLVTPTKDTIEVVTKLNDYVVNAETDSGLVIANTLTIPDGAGGYAFTFGRFRSPGWDGLRVIDKGKAIVAEVEVTTLPIWLRMRIEGSGASSVIYFDYSINGTDWDNLHIENNLSWSLIGLQARSWGDFNGISAPFEFFNYSYGDPLVAATLTGSSGDFTIGSNTKVTIPAGKFPTLAEGTYSLYLRKYNAGGISAPECYAGDWACDPDGRVHASNRITFYVSDTYVDRPFRTRKAPILLTDWHLKARSDASEVMKYYSMNYIRCPDRVYKGNLSAISSIPRGFEGKTGMFKVSDLTLDLANNDLEFSKLLAGGTILKNQLVKLYQAYPDEPFGWRSHIISLIIDDYWFEDEIFKVKMKDITQKYFRVSVPRESCLEADYPNIHPDSIGASIPEVLGLCSLTTGEFKGQVEAICIDTSAYKYVAANRALKSIDEVYSDDIVAIDPGNYTVTIEEDGRTYITFTESQANKKVTFNCKGYIYAGLNSDNGYIQNPAYILLYFLLVILKIPPTLIDIGSFYDTATVFENMGEGEGGKLILQDQQKSMDVSQDLLAGSKFYPSKDGRLTLGKKDISNWSTNNSETVPVIFRQLDVIGKYVRKYNMRDAINIINADFDYIPTWDIFKSNVSQRGEVWIDPIIYIPIEDDRISQTPRTRRRERHTRYWAR